MAQGLNSGADHSSDNLDDALRTLTSELARADAKASIVLAMTGVGLGFVVTQGSRHQGDAVLAVGSAGAMCLVIAIVVLLVTVRPVHIDTVTAEGWSRWATLEPDSLHDHMRADLRAERVSFLSRTVVIKFRRLRLGINLILAGVILLCAATVLSLVL
ncbi:Pycsar system effector family protein [Streptomyces sp. LUP47B]|uniref:Pycsar system effector family protein n=1 Tax=Streptomyces sp. LUP47B TaxID=1890286 RepID=UPI00085179CA|nr:Pycsar system effector family protein [Streptomyces sp. LUP47B]